MNKKINFNMTSNTTPVPFVVSASSFVNSTYPAWKAFSGVYNNDADSWVSSSNDTNKWIKIDFGSIKKVNKTILRQRKVNSTTTAPKDFILYGSNDDITYNKIHEVNNLKWEIGENKTFSFNSVSYRFYRLNILSTTDGGLTAGLNGIEFLLSESYLNQFLSVDADSFKNYGMSGEVSFNPILPNKNYILQDTVSENTDGLWVQETNRKPLSIKFE